MDCDYPQHSVCKQKERDMATVKASASLQAMLVAQAQRLGGKAYLVIPSRPQRALDDWAAFAAGESEPYDIVLFDLPGTAGSNGVLTTITRLDHLFVPLKPDRMVLESTLNFAATIHDRLIMTGTSKIRSLHLF